VRTAEITLALEKKETQQETDYKSDIKKTTAITSVLCINTHLTEWQV